MEVWNPILGITGCNDLHIAQNGGDTSRASCNYQHNNNGEVIVDSQVEAQGHMLVASLVFVLPCS